LEPLYPQFPGRGVMSPPWRISTPGLVGTQFDQSGSSPVVIPSLGIAQLRLAGNKLTESMIVVWPEVRHVYLVAPHPVSHGPTGTIRMLVIILNGLEYITQSLTGRALVLIDYQFSLSLARAYDLCLRSGKSFGMPYFSVQRLAMAGC